MNLSLLSDLIFFAVKDKSEMFYGYSDDKLSIYLLVDLIFSLDGNFFS